MKKTYALLATMICALLQAAYSQSINEATLVVDGYVDGMINHLYDDTYREDFANKEFHPDVNELGLHLRYSSIPEKIVSYPHLNIVLDYKLVRVYSSSEKVFYSQKQGDFSYFAKISFTAIGVSNSGELKAAKNPIEIIEYIVLAVDYTDGKIKIVDIYPEPNSRFISVAYARKHIELVSRIGQVSIADLRKMLR